MFDSSPARIGIESVFQLNRRFARRVAADRSRRAASDRNRVLAGDPSRLPNVVARRSARLELPALAHTWPLFGPVAYGCRPRRLYLHGRLTLSGMNRVKTTIISGADASFFDLLLGLIRSIRACPESRDLDLCILDVGLTQQQIAQLTPLVTRIVPAEWNVEFPGATSRRCVRRGTRPCIAGPSFRDTFRNTSF